MPTNRNDPCPCGSGKKYKKCCLGKDGARSAATAVTEPGVDLREMQRNAQALHRNGHLNRAARVYRQVLRRGPRNAAVLFYLGQLMGQLGKLEQGIDLLRRSVALDKTNERAKERHISTPSYAAVTPPIHERAVGRWTRYAKHFEPYMHNLEPYIEEFGYASDEG